MTLNKNSIYLPKEISESLSIVVPTKNDENQLVDGKLSNVWHSSYRRSKFQHLSNNPACVCGAGEDMNFVYNGEISELINEPEDKKRRRRNKIENKTIVKIPEKLVPKELNLVTHFGAKPIKFIDKEFTTAAVPHINHKVSFPLMYPSNKKLAKQALKSIEPVLKCIDFENFSIQIYPTSLHRLLSLVKKEQDLYNTIFYNIIKETTVECIERGELLANVRQRYRVVLTQVPKCVKNYHDTIVVQRILGKRLTEETTRFQNTVSQLSGELEAVKQHKKGIAQLCQKSKDKLKEAVKETKTNADLLREYYSLYELQRHRLEQSVSQIEREKVCWKSANYDLIKMVMQQYSLQNGLRLMENETVWFKDANYFVTLLSNTDDRLLNSIKHKTVDWQSDANQFMTFLDNREQNIKRILEKEMERILNLKEDFGEDFFNEQGQFTKAPDRQETQNVYVLLVNLEETMNKLSETFSGNIMLKEEENINKMKGICFDFTDLAVGLFNRHRTEGDDDKLYPEHSDLLQINTYIEQYMNQLMDQLTGNNGVIDGIFNLQSYLESWIAKLAQCFPDGGIYRPLPESEWTRLYLALDDWVTLLTESVEALGRVTSPIVTKIATEDTAVLTSRTIEPAELIEQVGTWVQRSTGSIQSENVRLQESVSNLNQRMIRWTAQTLLRLAPDNPSNSAEARRAARTASIGIRELHESRNLIVSQLDRTSALINKCTKDIVRQLLLEKLDKQEENAGEDTEKLNILLTSTKGWIEDSEIMLKEMMEKEYEYSTKLVSKQHPEEDDNKLEDKEKTEELKENTEKDKEEEKEEEESYVKSESGTDEKLNEHQQDGREEDNKVEGVNELMNFVFQDVMTDSQRVSPASEQEIDDAASPPEDVPTQIQGIGYDSNVHTKFLVQNPDEAYEGNKFRNNNNLQSAQLDVELPQTENAYKLLKVAAVLQQKLREITIEAKQSESDSTATELELLKCKDTLKMLETRFSKVSADLESIKDEKSKELDRPALLSSGKTLGDRSESRNSEKTAASTKSNKKRATQKKAKK